MVVIVFLTWMQVPLSRWDGVEALPQVELTGQVVSVVQKAEGYQLTVRVCSLTPIGNAGTQTGGAGEKVLLTYYGKLDAPWTLLCREISCLTALSLPTGQRNPGCFDYRLYLKSRGIFRTGVVQDLRMAEKKSFSLVQQVTRWLFRQRWAYQERLGSQAAAIVSGLLFGDTTAMTEADYDAFRRNGTAHVLAVSGLHIGILYQLWEKIAGKQARWGKTTVLLFLLWGYGLLAQWSPSVVRASMMILLRLFARQFALRYDGLTALSAVAIGLLLYNPYMLFGAGFQMSFLAIASICFFSPVLPEGVPGAMRTAIAVQAGLLPYQMLQFNYISFVAPVANLPIVFLAGMLVPLALASFGWFALSGDLGPFGLLLDSMSFLLLRINSLSTLGGFGACDVVSPPLWLTLALYGISFFLASEDCLVLRLRKKRKRIAVFLVGCLFMGLLAGQLFDEPVSRADLVFVDVGQGDCVHLRDGRRNALIDGGGSVSYNIGKNTLKPYLLKNGARQLDVALATHLHTDHYKGLIELTAIYPVRQLLTGQIRGDRVRLSDHVMIETLWPLDLARDETGQILPDAQEENGLCSVFMIDYDGWRILVTGDLDEAGEREMLAFYQGTTKLKADILKIGHHGSKTSTSTAFLDAVSPMVAVIQVGAHNNYGHPAQMTIEKCQKKGIILYRNDVNGAVGVSFDRHTFTVDVMMKDAVEG